LFCGALISAKACSFFSFVCCVIASLITPGVYRTPINGGDNYFDAGGGHKQKNQIGQVDSCKLEGTGITSPRKRPHPYPQFMGGKKSLIQGN
ncbi:MAG TPA: hypothetical protein VEC35_11840, partial [Noviherbaspirillum sp.]|nr:hypothetical protein [Noviherbaspirillum sp.]